MKKLLVSATLLFGLNGLMAVPDAHAAELTMAQVQSELPSIKNQARKFAMIKFFNECKAKRLFTCHLAWFDLNAAGLDMVYNVKSGLESWQFENDPKSTALYRAITIALTHPNYRDGWDLVVRPKYMDAELPTEAAAREGLYDDTWNFATLDIVSQHFEYANIEYETGKGFTDPRGEWIRYLALVFAIRGDASNTYTAINELKSYAKINTANGVLYNNTLSAVQKYLSTKGVSK